MKLFNGVVIIIATFVLWGCSSPKQVSRLSHSRAQVGAGIFGGQNVTPADSFSQNVVGIISISRDDEGGIRSRELCTGALIGTNVVLTAAHCLTEDSEVEVYFGPNMYGDNVVKRKVVSRILHGDWRINQKEGVNDIAMIRFEGSLPLEFKPISLVKLTSVIDNFDAYIVGYGRTSGQKMPPQNQKSDPRQGAGVIRKATIVALGLDVEETSIEMKQMYNQGACNGDSGGPAFMKVGNEYILIGIASYAKLSFTDEQKKYFRLVRGDMTKYLAKYPDFDFCKQDSFYMNVSYFVDWINFNLVAL